jgi:predicted extracellular nuclease
VDAGLGAELLAQLADNAALGRLVFSTVDGDTDKDGDIDELYVFGARSFSIFNEDGTLVYDSGDDFEQITAVEAPTLYNAEEGDAGEIDNRSDNKGPEPEAVVTGEIDGRTYAFVALERTGGVMVYDVTDPEAPTYEQYLQTPGDFAPEGLRFITADESTTGNPLLAISSEVSETLSFYEIELGAEEITLISTIQGSSDFSGLPGFAKVGVNDRSALVGQIVTIEAIVTADFQGAINLNGFFVQEEDADQDGNSFTSEGLFINDALLTQNVNLGDLVRITGTVGEVFGQTQISASSITVVAENQLFPTATIVDLGSTGVMLDDDPAVDYVVNLEFVEGMLVTFTKTVTVAEMFNLDRFGEIRVSSEGRIEQFTQSNAGSVAGYDAHLQDVAARNLVLDDGSGVSNPFALEIPDGNNGVLDANDSFRMGDTLTNLTGVVAYGFDEFRLNDATADYTSANPRPTEPADIGGNFKVASLNVLNFFTTLDTNPGANNGPNTSGPNNTLEPRGANSAAELERQAAKTVEAIIAMDADVLGLVEIENDDDIAVADLVARVNAEIGTETYGYIATGDVGTDAITTAIIYKLATVEPIGTTAILTTFNGTSFVDPLGAGSQQNRPAVAQTFRDIATDTEITVAVNHLKSKSSSTGVAADADQLDGQGPSNATRTAAAAVLADWLASDPTGTGAENQLIIGDLNAYGAEDPITTLAAAGFVDVAGAILGDSAYSYVFDGQIGTLDYILANGPAFAQVAGATEWHINADEADALDYNLDFGRDPALYDSTTASRNSDHDPVIVSFDLRKLLIGTAGSDTLRAPDAGAIIDGLGGRDIYIGGAGADTFVMGNGDKDQLRNVDAALDKLDLRAWGVQSFDELEIFDRGDLITFLDRVSGNAGYLFDRGPLSAAAFTADTFVFAPVQNLIVAGMPAATTETLYGRAGDDRLVSDGAGFNQMFGQGGDDTFVIGLGRGDVVRDFEIGSDLLDLSAWSANDFADLRITETEGQISIRDADRQLVRIDRGETGLSAADFASDSFIFVDTLMA